MTRSEAFNLTDTELSVAIGGARNILRRAWDRGEPGSVTALYDLALLTAETQWRGRPLGAPWNPAQLALPI